MVAPSPIPNAGADRRDAAPKAPADASALHSVSPLHVLLLGGAALGSGAAITASLAYKEAGKRLKADGIDPRARHAVLPLALRAAAGSLALTAAAAAGGFWLLRELGAVQDKPAALPSPGEAWSVLRGRGANGTTGDGSTIEALSAAWRRREVEAAGAGRQEDGDARNAAVVVVPERGRRQASVGAGAEEKQQQQQDRTGGWWWSRWRRGRRRDDDGEGARAPSAAPPLSKSPP